MASRTLLLSNGDIYDIGYPFQPGRRQTWDVMQQRFDYNNGISVSDGQTF
jgi:hypothetical protein